MTFAQYLEKKYVDWQKENERRMTLGEFASYLGFKQSTVTMWMNGNRTPDGENLRKLSLVLGVEVYEMAGEEIHPDEDLLYIERHWDFYTAAQRRALREKDRKSVV